MKIKNPLSLIFSLLICHAAGIVGSLFTVQAIPTWYETIIKPSFNPPSWVFGPVWLLLYTLMGIALYLLWQKGAKRRKEIVIFYGQLFFNALWSIFFFGFHNILLALFDLILIWLLTAVLIARIWRQEKAITLLLAPYLLWLSFAAVLNYAILLLNAQ